MAFRPVADKTLGLRVTTQEKAALEAEAAAEGITLSVLLYRRVFDKPDARRPRGRRRKHEREQPEGLFDDSGLGLGLTG